MFLQLYNIIQLLALLLLWPVVFAVVFFVPKYRGRIGRRIGWGLKKVVLPEGRKRIWVHALSVGESASAKPLLAAIKEKYPDVFLIFSTTTRGGEQFSESLKGLVDLKVPFPVDLFWVVRSFVRHLRPDLFVLIETDFWPNLLGRFRKNKVPCLLVNGRITEASINRYMRLRPLFQQLFDSFDQLFMQTERDAENMVRLGVLRRKVHNVGNLKYDMAKVRGETDLGGRMLREELHLAAGRTYFVAGSTHEGEEEAVLRVFRKLQNNFPDLFLILAPRDVSRGEEIASLALKEGFVARRRMSRPKAGESVLVLDTLGELGRIYAFADVVFVGGSLVDEGGHNPLEPAFFGKPVLFGPHMADFAEVVRDLEEIDAAVMVKDEDGLFQVLAGLLSDDAGRHRMGDAGLALVAKHQGAAERCLEQVSRVVQL